MKCTLNSFESQLTLNVHLNLFLVSTDMNLTLESIFGRNQLTWTIHLKVSLKSTTMNRILVIVLRII